LRGRGCAEGGVEPAQELVDERGWRGGGVWRGLPAERRRRRWCGRGLGEGPAPARARAWSVLEEMSALVAVVHTAVVVAGHDPGRGSPGRSGSDSQAEGSNEDTDGEPSDHRTSPFPGPEREG